MKLITDKIKFETEFGDLEIFSLRGGYVFEFTSGWNNGLHCDVPFPTFDKCYSHIKGRRRDWKAEMAAENRK